jgi:hypothetical protein
MGEIREGDNNYGYVCGCCGEQSIVSFLNSLDILNDLHLKGEMGYQSEEDVYLEDLVKEEEEV